MPPPTSFSLLACEIGLALAITALAVVDHHILVPRLRTTHGAAVRAIRVGTIAEILLGAVVALVSIFELMDPA